MENKELVKFICAIFISIMVSLLLIFASYEPKNVIYEGKFIVGNEKQELTKVKSLQEENNNEDIKGYLTIPGTSISEPVLQGKDNEFYLSRGINKKKNLIGSVYLDYRVKINEKKNIIFSHNSSTLDVPFKELENYYDKDYYLNHQYIYLEDTNKIQKYQIFSVFVEVKDWSYMQLEFSQDEWLNHINNLKNKSWHENDIILENDDEILILQTCSHHKKFTKYNNKYLLIVAKKV